MSPYEKNILNQLKVHTLYIKFFDVDWDSLHQKVMPSAKITFRDPSYRGFNIIPVVFITNETLIHTPDAQIQDVARHITGLIGDIMWKAQMSRPTEIQFDCDWTAATKDKYFLLLKTAHEQLYNSGESKTLISATIRLYQCKYLTETGVPPVSRGLLMCYNMGDLKSPGTGNSILDPDVLKKYVTSIHTYPLPLDVALPLFDWKVLFRDGLYRGLVEGLPDSLLQHSPAVKQDHQRFTFLSDTTVAGYSFKKGDILRAEQSNYPDIIKVGDLLSEKLNTQDLHVILYDLDSLTLSKYTVHEMENMFDRLH